MSRYGLLCLLTVLALLAMQMQNLYHARALLQGSARRERLFPLLALANTILLMCGVWTRLHIGAFYGLAFALYTLELFFLYRKGAVSSVLVGGMSVFTQLCLHGVTIPLDALVDRSRMYFIVQDPFHYLLALLLAVAACSGALALFRRLVPLERMRLLLRSRPQARLACTSMCILLCYLLLETYVYYYDFPLDWTSVFHMITSLVAMASFYVVLCHAIDISAYIEYELKTRQVEKQLQRQVVHYRQYTRYINDLRAFKHDYRRMAGTVRHLVGVGEQEKALRLLMQMDEEMESSLQYIPYSNHVVVDAILQECGGRCREAGIAFSAVANLPERIGLTDLELCRIFGNLVENAYEACALVRDGERFIRVESAVSGGWVTVQISNRFTGRIELSDGLPATSKRDKDRHGIGLASTRQLVESTGGFLQFEVDRERGVFTVRMHLCAS